MKIENDPIEFTTGDFDGFSDPVKKALLGYLEETETYFANRLNALVADAKQSAKNLAAQAPSINTVLESYAAADATKRAAAEPLLASLNTLLNS